MIKSEMKELTEDLLDLNLFSDKLVELKDRSLILSKSAKRKPWQ